MLSPEEKLAKRIGRIDAVLFFVLVAVIQLLSTAHPYCALPPPIIFIVVPASAIVGWRGTVPVHLLLQGRANMPHRTIEGFLFA